MKKTLLLTAALLMALTTAWAQGPNGSGTYYQYADGKKGSELKSAFSSILNSGTHNIGYDGLIDAYKKTDMRADGKLRDWYSNVTNYTWDDRNGNNAEGAGWNREHSVPQSWFNKANPMKSDIVHVIPTDCYVNNRRSNYPFGEVQNVTYQSANGYSKLGSCKTEGYSGTVFEPNDEIKGDIARIYFYMITRYESSCGSWGNDVFTNTYPGLTTWTLNMMMRWSQQDPVDEVEIARNNGVYETQWNRNPYVDYPGLEEYTWGSKMDQAFSYDNYEGGEVDPNHMASPVFSPASGTYANSVTVSISTSTENANIYYTLDGSDATPNSTLYTGSFTLTETTTVKAIAVKEDKESAQSTATYTITTGGETPVDGEIGLNDALFGTQYGGSIPSSDTESLIGTQNGVTVIYDIGEGSNRYCNDSQIRIYPGNRLSLTVSEGTIMKLEFTSPEPKSGLAANVGTMTDDLIWTGNAQSVTFSWTASKHIKLSSVIVTLSQSDPSGIAVVRNGDQSAIIYDLQGRRVEHPTKGIYIVNGKKVVIK